jgi:hypothetical protein
MVFKTMDQAVIRKLLEEQEDILTPAIKSDRAFFNNTRCPMCGEGECQKKSYEPKIEIGDNGEPIVRQSSFGSGPLADGYAHCIDCGTDFNPYTGMIFSTEVSMIHGPE